MTTSTTSKKKRTTATTNVCPTPATEQAAASTVPYTKSPPPLLVLPEGLNEEAFRRERGRRQRDLVPIDKLAALEPVVLGVGAVGRNLALALTQLGVDRLTLVDPDRVNLVNVNTQGYKPEQISQPKPEATLNDCLRLNPWLEFRTRHLSCTDLLVQPLLQAGPGRTLVYLVAVDSIEIRKWIHQQAVVNQAAVLLDVRMLGESVRVFRHVPGTTYYPTTFFEAAEAQRGTCGDRSFGPAAALGANLAVYLLVQWLRGETGEEDRHLHLPTLELFQEPDLEKWHVAQRSPAAPVA